MPPVALWRPFSGGAVRRRGGAVGGPGMPPGRPCRCADPPLPLNPFLQTALPWKRDG